VTITKSMTISCSIGTGGIAASNVNGIIVNAASPAEVVIDGLDIEGFGTGINGVHIIGATKVTINRTQIRNFTQNGVNVVGPAGARAVIQDTLILSSATGVNVVGAGGAINVATLIRTTVDNNSVASVNATAPNIVALNGSTLIGTAASVAGGGTVNTFGNNAIGGTTTALTSTPLK